MSICVCIYIYIGAYVWVRGTSRSNSPKLYQINKYPNLFWNHFLVGMRTFSYVQFNLKSMEKFYKLVLCLCIKSKIYCNGLDKYSLFFIAFVSFLFFCFPFTLKFAKILFCLKLLKVRREKIHYITFDYYSYQILNNFIRICIYMYTYVCVYICNRMKCTWKCLIYIHSINLTENNTDDIFWSEDWENKTIKYGLFTKPLYENKCSLDESCKIFQIKFYSAKI